MDFNNVQNYSINSYISFSKDEVINEGETKTSYLILFRKKPGYEDSDGDKDNGGNRPVYYDDMARDEAIQADEATPERLLERQGHFIKIFYGRNPDCIDCYGGGGGANGLLILNLIFSLFIFIFVLAYFIIGLYKLCIKKSSKQPEETPDSDITVEEEPQTQGFEKMEEIEIKDQHNVEK